MDKSIQLHQFNLWANNKVFEQLKSLPAEVYRKEVDSVFPTIADVLIHMHQVDYVWLKALKGEKFEDILDSLKSIYQELNESDLHDMQLKFEKMGSDYETFMAQKADLFQETTVHHPHFGTLHSSYADLIQHIVNHGTYHRGHISAILNQQGHKGASTDYIFYLYSLQQQY
ncbi:hypothetical protein AWM68_18865 [Fictibacillus phosphorivorans]|uniref:Damage-inducible protein DinB n=1 Tax=Fictibacillus phosphorivorans TaxID=1221500 RepID=A0A163RZK8_9BACL|nr:DinB family protein [Fictibacillus phosphorivorans]KZE67827.1 hypothetical protein AWM68_18865 [Fictibacillus phosphorivorans]